MRRCRAFRSDVRDRFGCHNSAWRSGPECRWSGRFHLPGNHIANMNSCDDDGRETPGTHVARRVPAFTGWWRGPIRGVRRSGARREPKRSSITGRCDVRSRVTLRSGEKPRRAARRSVFTTGFAATAGPSAREIGSTRRAGVSGGKRRVVNYLPETAFGVIRPEPRPQSPIRRENGWSGDASRVRKRARNTHRRSLSR